MKTTKRIYYILTYTFFIYPPFIWGLVLIYRERNYDTVHLTSLLINALLVLVLVGICALLIIKKKLHFPTEREQRYLLFGFIGNIIIYFYTFQNLMHIENIVTVYLTLLLILGVHYLLIERKIIALELWVLLPIFLVIDYLHWAISGCGWTNYWRCMQYSTPPSYIYALYVIIPIPIIVYYVYKIYLLKPRDLFKYINMVLVAVLSIAFLNMNNIDEKFLATIGIMLPFFLIVDFIVSIVNKVYHHKTLIFYLRTSIILLVFGMMGGLELLQGNADEEMLPLMVVVTYSSLSIVLLTSLLHVKIDGKQPIGKEVKFVNYTTDFKELLTSTYSQMHTNHMKLGDDSFSLIAIKEDNIIGMISTYKKFLSEPFTTEFDAYINILEVLPEYRNKGLATNLIKRTEKHYKSLGYRQLRAWSSIDKTEALHLWKKMHYTLNPTTLHYADEEVDGYFVSKIL